MRRPVAPPRSPAAAPARRRPPRRLLVALVPFLVLGVPACADPSPSGGTGGGAAGGVAVVERVVDGDTIVVRLGGTTEQVRLIGIDTPETSDPRRPVECFGHEAAARTAELLPAGTPVRLERDAEARDRYNRLLAYVHRGRLFVNLALVEEGFAAAATFPPNVAHRDAIVGAAADARAAGRGLWGRCGGPDVPAP